MQPSHRSKRAVFLDRDGTLNRDIGFAYRLEDLKLLDHVVPGLTRMADLGLELFITTNQSGVARGYFTEDDMHAFNLALCQRLCDAGIRIAGVYACITHPTAGIGKYRCDSPLRKPRPGMILQAAAEHDLDLAASFAVGDRMSDVQTGHAAGCRTILIGGGGEGARADKLAVRPDFTAADLVAAAAWIERALPQRFAASQTLRTPVAVGDATCSTRPGSLH